MATGEDKRATMTSTKPRSETSDEAVLRATGKSCDDWFAILDAAGACELAHREIAVYLREQENVSPWWSQEVTVQYERARGLREKHQTLSGYQVSVSKTIAVPLDALYAACADDNARSSWLGEAPLTVRKATPSKSVRATWGEGASSVDIGCYEKGAAKSQVTVQHSKLADQEEVEEMRTYWKAALERLAGDLGAGRR